MRPESLAYTVPRTVDATPRPWWWPATMLPRLAAAVRSRAAFMLDTAQLGPAPLARASRHTGGRI